MKRWKLVRSMLKNLGYSQVDADDITFNYIDSDGNIYFTTEDGSEYKAKWNSTTATKVSNLYVVYNYVDNDYFV